jgi:hypothetical protein
LKTKAHSRLKHERSAQKTGTRLGRTEAVVGRLPAAFCVRIWDRTGAGMASAKCLTLRRIPEVLKIDALRHRRTREAWRRVSRDGAPAGRTAGRMPVN